MRFLLLIIMLGIGMGAKSLPPSPLPEGKGEEKTLPTSLPREEEETPLTPLPRGGQVQGVQGVQEVQESLPQTPPSREGLTSAISHQPSAIEKSPIVTFEDNHYTIDIAALNPDEEMTLMDVLQMCPEMLSCDNRTITANFSISTNGMDLLVDEEVQLEKTRALDLEKIEIYSYGMIAENTNGGAGIINLTFKKGTKPVSGKVSAQGSTYGNGLLYADVLTHSEKLSVRGVALGAERFMRRRPSSETVVTEREFVEGVHMGIDWDISKNDNLMVLLTQEYKEEKEKGRGGDPSGNFTVPTRNRLTDISGIYTHNFENNMGVFAEGSMNYENYSSNGKNSHDVNSHIYTGLEIPCLNDNMTIKTGWDIDYLNYSTPKDYRYQLMQNDFYVLANYNIGRWLLSAGYRLGILDLWKKAPKNDGSKEKSFNVNYTNCYTATVGYNWGRNTLTAIICREHYYYIVDLQDPLEFEVDNYDHAVQDLSWRSEMSYTYQKNKFVFRGGVYQVWGEEIYGTNHSIVTLRASATWLAGRLRLTAGADYNHQRTKIEDDDSYFKRYDNYYHLKLIPALTMGRGFRLSSALIYSSSKLLHTANQHFYASVKLNKQFGRNCNIYAEFHDLTDLPDNYEDQVHGRFYNRAVTIGGSFYF